MSVESNPNDLVKVVTLLGTAVVMVPLFKRLGLGSVLGYLVAGMLIGPFGLGWFKEPHAILSLAELGVVMFLFLIGLEMRPSHLWHLKKQIFGLGLAHTTMNTVVLGSLGLLYGLSFPVAFIVAVGFSLTSTAMVIQILSDRGEIALPSGQRVVSVLLFEDLLIAPLLVLVAFMSTADVTSSTEAGASGLTALMTAVGSIGILIAAGLWLLNPLFRVLALAKAREVFTAAALLVVLGAALLMQESGLSMAMGAFLAGVLLSESSFRHQIEADIQPFRGILLGLFFMGVGMSLDLSIANENSTLIFTGALVMISTKMICVYVVDRLMGLSNRESINRALLMCQGGEFAFVLYATAVDAKVIEGSINSYMTTVIVLSMMFTPIILMVGKWLMPKAEVSKEGIEDARDLTGSVLIVGFGRFGQILSQMLLARDTDVTIIDSNANMIRNASKFGFKIYYGDGSRLDVLRASGAQKARVIAICIDEKETVNHMVDLIKNEFPQAQILVRAFDRTHARVLVKQGVDYQLRELFESSIHFGEVTLKALGVEEDEILEISQDIRRRDAERFELDLAADDGTGNAGRHLMFGNVAATPTPFIKPKRETQVLNEEAEEEVAKK